MEEYNPYHAPDPEEWLAMDEDERILLIERWHLAHDKQDIPNVTAHAVMHAIVENQLAEKVETVQAALKRLLREGLERHEAIHAIAAVFNKHYFDVMKGQSPKGKDLNQLYQDGLKKLTAKRWKRGKY